MSQCIHSHEPSSKRYFPGNDFDVFRVVVSHKISRSSINLTFYINLQHDLCTRWVTRSKHHLTFGVSKISFNLMMCSWRTFFNMSTSRSSNLIFELPAYRELELMLNSEHQEYATLIATIAREKIQLYTCKMKPYANSEITSSALSRILTSAAVLSPQGHCCQCIHFKINFHVITETFIHFVLFLPMHWRD